MFLNKFVYITSNFKCSRLLYSFKNQNNFSLNSLGTREINSNSCTNHQFPCTLSRQNLFMIKRYKHKEKRSQVKQDESDNEDEEDELEIDEEYKNLPKAKGSKIIRTSVPTMRIDAILKQALGITRNKIEEAFYASRIRRNGEKLLKKSSIVHIHDELDLILEDKKAENPNFIYIHRVKLLNGKLDGDIYRIVLLREKNLLIENYETFEDK